MANLQVFSRNRSRLFVLLSMQLFVVVSLSTLHVPAFGQTIQINADGSQTLTLNNGSYPNIQVNPDGSHTLIYDNGCTQTWVNPDGTHSVMLNATTQTPVLVNSDGSQTQIYRNGNIEIRTLSDGSSKTYFISEPFITEISSIGPSINKQSKTSKKTKMKRNL